MITEENCLPALFMERMNKLLGEEYPAFLAAVQGEKTQALRFRRTSAWETAFFSSVNLIPIPWARDAYTYPSSWQPGKHPFHMAGAYYIQESSAMYPVTLLNPQPGEKVLDLCAAPGGKSTQIASYMEQSGFLLSNEIHPARAKILSENTERMGVRCSIVTQEDPKLLGERFEAFFDRVLVDAPCSGEGMFRKHPEAVKEWSLENVLACAARQEAILEQADKMLRPGGYLVYSTCTFAPEENEGTISRFLHTHPNYEILPAMKYPGMSEGVPSWIPCPAPHLERTVRLFPHKIQGEGHFAALLQKNGDPSADYRSMDQLALFPKPSREEMRLWESFAEETLYKIPKGELIIFGKQLYLLPNYFTFSDKKKKNGYKGQRSIEKTDYHTTLPKETFQGLKVLRPGLHLGTFEKYRFEPSHALALTLHSEDAVHVYICSDQEDESYKYLHGYSFPAEGSGGWYLVTSEGYSMGWAKLAGGMLKNHFPKGLRLP
jgi:NOL1/NOP2/sun family putative RNA methylase